MRPEEKQLPIGARLAELRARRGFNMRELSKMSGASTSLISQIEKGRTNPTVQKLQNLATALGVPVSYFFDPHDGDQEGGATARRSGRSGKDRAAATHTRVRGEAGDAVEARRTDGRRQAAPAHHPTPVGRAGVVSAGRRATIELHDGVHWERLTLGGHPEIEFLEVTYLPGTNSGELAYHYGDEFVLVLDGELVVELGFDQYILASGDSMAFDSTTPHRVSNNGTVPMRAIWVNWTRSSENGA